MHRGSIKRLGSVSLALSLVAIGMLLGRPPAGPAPVLAAGTPPDAPTAVTARAADGSAIVRWTPPLFTGGQPLLSYLVTASSGGATCSATPPATSCSVSGLNDGVPYTFRVTATTADGTSGPSDPSAAVTPLAGTTGVNFIGAYGSVMWNAGTVGADGFTPAVDPLSKVYNGAAGTPANGVEYAATVNASKCTAAWDWFQILCDPSGATNELGRVYKSNADVGITLNTDNIPTIRGYVVIDLGAVRNFTTLRIFQMFSDGKVTDARLSISGNTSGTFPTVSDGSWTTAVPRTGIGTGQGSRSAGYITCPTILDFGAHSGRYILLEFWNAGQFGDPSWVEVGAAKLFFENTVAPASSGCSPQPPTAVAATAGNRSAQVSWTAASSADPLTAGAIQYSSNGGGSWSNATTTPSPLGGSATTALVTGLNNGTPYVFRVNATNASGTSPWSLPSGPATPIAVPDPPTNVVATPGDGQATLAWTASTTSGSSVTGYTVTSSPDDRTCTAGAAPTTCDVTGLRNTVAYTLTVVAHSAAGDSLPATSNSVTPFTAPDAPSGLIATSGDASASVAFSAGGNGGSAITNYEFSITDGATWTPLSPPVTASPVVIPGLTNGTAYSVRLRAVNLAGPGAASDPVSVTPHSMPTVISASPSSADQGATALDVDVAGTDFVTGAAAAFSETGITVNSTTFVSATHVTASITIGATAPTGLRDITVTNPDTGSATAIAAFTVEAGPPPPDTQSITFPTLGDVRLDQPAPVPAATASSDLPVAYSSATPTVCGVTVGGTITLVHAGLCTVDADQAGDATFAPADTASQSFTIGRGNQAIDFGPLADSDIAASPLTVAASASSGLEVVFTTTTISVCTVSGSSVTLAAGGLCTISAAQTGNTDWNEATAVERSFTVTGSAVSPSPSPTSSPVAEGITTDSDTPAAGATLHITAWGFEPGGSVSLYLHPAPVLLGTFTADGLGWIDVRVTLPAGTAAGSHQIEATGPGSAGTVSVEHAITVVTSAASPTAARTPPATSSEAPGGSGRSPWDGGLVQLSLTGLLAGLLAAAYCTRRQPELEPARAGRTGDRHRDDDQG